MGDQQHERDGPTGGGTSPPGTVDAPLAAAVALPGGDLAAFYPKAYQRLVGSLRLMGVPHDDALESAQEAFARLVPRWEAIRHYDQPDSWLRTVAWRVWVQRAVKDRRLTLTDVDGDLDAPVLAIQESAAPAGAVTRVSLHAALGELATGHREVVVLHYLHDLPVAQIARELDLAEGTVKSRLHRARAALATSPHLREVDHD